MSANFDLEEVMREYWSGRAAAFDAALGHGSAMATLKFPRFRGRLAGRDHSFSAMALASYSMGER
jgi:hypothetical protein